MIFFGVQKILFPTDDFHFLFHRKKFQLHHLDFFVYIRFYGLITVTFHFSPFSTFQKSGGLAAICNVCYNPTVLSPFIITHPAAL